MEVSAQHYLWQIHPPVRSTINHWTGGWVVSEAGTDVVWEKKIPCPYQEKKLSLYTDQTILAPHI